MPSTQELLNQRNALQNQFNDVSTAVAPDEAIRYLNQYAGNFEPLQRERRQIQAQAGSNLVNQLGDYYKNQQPPSATIQQVSGADPLNMLSSIINTGQNLRATSDLLGDQITTGRGNLANIANSALSQTAQKQNTLKALLDQINQDYNAQVQREYQAQEAEKQRQFQAQEAAKSRRVSGGGGSGGGSNVLDAINKLFAQNGGAMPTPANVDPQTARNKANGINYVVSERLNANAGQDQNNNQNPDFWGNLKNVPLQIQSLPTNLGLGLRNLFR